MPFELGMAYSLSPRQSHRFFVLESKIHRLQATLSDLNGLDPHIHGGTQTGVLRSVLDCFATPTGTPDIRFLKALTRDLTGVLSTLQRDQGLDHPFHPYLFRQAVRAAAKLAENRGLIP